MNIGLGDTRHLVQAIFLPQINIKMDIPGLGRVVKAFKDKGYTLADKYLRETDNEIKGIDFILGTTNGYCLPQREVAFGRDNMSVLSHSSIGIMLTGDVDQYLRDLPWLPAETYPVLSPPYKSTILSATSDLVPTNSDYFKQCYSVLDDNGNVIENELQRESQQMLEAFCSNSINTCVQSDSSTENHEIDSKLTKFAIENMTHKEDGRLVVPLLWNDEVAHLLCSNFNLAKAVLNSTLKKL